MVIKIVLFTLFFSIVSCQHQEKQTSSVEMKEGTDVDLAKLVLYPDDHVQYFISGQNDSAGDKGPKFPPLDYQNQPIPDHCEKA